MNKYNWSQKGKKQSGKAKKIIYHLSIVSAISTGIILFFLFLLPFTSLSRDIRILEGDKHYVNLPMPFVYVRIQEPGEVITLNGQPAPIEHSRFEFPIDVEGVALGETNLEFSLFGRIPLRQVTINVIPQVTAMPGGHSIGIKMQSEGVQVAGFYQIPSLDGIRSPAREAGIRKGDAILEVEGEKTNNIEETAEMLRSASEKGSVALTIKREEKELNITVYPVYSGEDREYRLGIYIRDTTAGVGTLSFFDPDTMRYGALGHVILDGETRKPVDMSSGEIVKANIISINSAKRGQPGEKTGVFVNQNDINGDIDKNSSFGIYGNLHNINQSNTSYQSPIPVALASQVRSGPGQLLTVLEGEKIESFDLVIERVIPQKVPSDKGMVIRITDEELINSTGGIVQGMSGSPIIQDGKMVGAITHVFVNDPRRGYGIFMEWMLYEADIPPAE